MRRKRIGQERLRDGKYSSVSEPYTSEATDSSLVRGRKARADAKASADKALNDDDALRFAVRDITPKWAEQKLRASKHKAHQSELSGRKCELRLKTWKEGRERGEYGPAQRIGKEKAPDGLSDMREWMGEAAALTR